MYTTVVVDISQPTTRRSKREKSPTLHTRRNANNPMAANPTEPSLPLPTRGPRTLPSRPSPRGVELRRQMAARRAAFERQIASARERPASARSHSHSHQTLSHQEELTGLKGRFRELEAHLAHCTSSLQQVHILNSCPFILTCPTIASLGRVAV